MFDWILIKLGRKLPPLPPIERPKGRDGRFVEFNKVMEREKLIREGK